MDNADDNISNDTYIEGDTITYTCLAFFESDMMETIACQGNGMWPEVSLVCREPAGM